MFVFSRRIFAAKEDFVNCDYFISFMTILEESLKSINCSNVVEIICYGLGHIGESTVSRYQLALLLCLIDKLKVECYVHDPILYSDECDVLETFGQILIPENEEGKHTIRTDGHTIVFMPHCPKQLVNNFLWKNWGTGLKNCILICNSFTKLIETQPHKLLNESVPFILNISSYVKEYNLINSFKFNNVFNDTSIHLFPEKGLNFITENFWAAGVEEPKYTDDVELVSKEIIEKLRIRET